MTVAPESARRTRAASPSGILPPPHVSGTESYPADEISIPPVTSHFGSEIGSDMSADDARDLEDSFFVRRAGLDAASNAKHAAGHADHEGHDAHYDHDHAAVDPRTAQKMSAAAHARRQHLSRYVKWTVGVSAALLLLGVGRVAFRGKPEMGPPPPIVHSAFAATVDTSPHSIAARDPNALPPPAEESQAAADKAVAALENAPAVPAANDAVQAPAQPAQAAAADPVAAQPVAPAVAPAAAQPLAPPAVVAAAAPSDKTAAQEKAASSKALERGNAKAAIEAGERSVALDATDGEAWLVLGAAYQQVGKNADAKRCFTTCTKEGKKGPISECRAMLQ
ncbi:MAG: hypothetical protein ABI461_03490 [Polyangiaceae bacterium]